MQRDRGLSSRIHLYGEPAKTLRGFWLRRRSQRREEGEGEVEGLWLRVKG